MNPTIENLVNARYEDVAEQRWQAEQRGWPDGGLTHELDCLDSYLNGSGTLPNGLAAALATTAGRRAEAEHGLAIKAAAAAEVLAEAGQTAWADTAANHADRNARYARTAATTARAFADSAHNGTAAGAAADAAGAAATGAEAVAAAARRAAQQAHESAAAATASIS